MIRGEETARGSVIETEIELSLVIRKGQTRKETHAYHGYTREHHTRHKLQFALLWEVT